MSKFFIFFFVLVVFIVGIVFAYLYIFNNIDEVTLETTEYEPSFFSSSATVLSKDKKQLLLRIASSDITDDERAKLAQLTATESVAVQTIKFNNCESDPFLSRITSSQDLTIINDGPVSIYITIDAFRYDIAASSSQIITDGFENGPGNYIFACGTEKESAPAGVIIFE